MFNYYIHKIYIILLICFMNAFHYNLKLLKYIVVCKYVQVWVMVHVCMDGYACTYVCVHACM